jgi:hypothetical protein
MVDPLEISKLHKLQRPELPSQVQTSHWDYSFKYIQYNEITPR